MKPISFAILVIVVGIGVVACGSPEQESVGKQANAGNGASIPMPAGTSANGANVAPQATNVDIAEVNNPPEGAEADQTIAMKESRKEKLDAMRAAGESGGPVKMMPPPKRPAPDDSEYWSMLTDVAIETREFRSHPQIAKVERINDGTRAKLRIQRRDGKVVELGDRVRDIATESVNTFVVLAGLRPAVPAESRPARPNPQKQQEQNLVPKP